MQNEIKEYYLVIIVMMMMMIMMMNATRLAVSIVFGGGQ
jgi:hypothetical protein